MKYVVISELSIMVVEDQKEARAVICNMLSEMGVSELHEAGDGREALQKLDALYEQDKHLDLVLCDWNMPGVTGVELLRQIRTVSPNLPFLMITGRSDLDSVKEAKMAGVSAYVAKPFSPEQLEAKIRIVMQKTMMKTKSA